MKTLGLVSSLMFLGGAVWADVAHGDLPSRPVLPRATGVAPPKRIADAPLGSTDPKGTPVTTADIPTSVRRAVVADAARRFKVADSGVVLTRAEQVTWGDGSLGCAEPGMYYTQNLVPGYIVVAKTAAGELVYHTDSREQVKSCSTALPRPNRKPADKPIGRATQPPAAR
jgi:hypothetical protein